MREVGSQSTIDSLFRRLAIGFPLCANAIASQIATVDAQIKKTDMRVSRATDGGVVSQLY